MTPPFDLDLTRIFASLKNQSLINEHIDDVVVPLVQDSDDVSHREPMVDKEIADRHPPLLDRIKRNHIRRITKDLLSDLKSVSTLLECHIPPRVADCAFQAPFFRILNRFRS
jgi:hypothetical protein